MPFCEKRKIDIRPAKLPKIMKSAGIMPYALMKTPAVIIGKITSPPPRIAMLTLNFLFLTDFGILAFLYFIFIFLICAFTLSDTDGIRNPPNIFSSSI